MKRKADSPLRRTVPAPPGARAPIRVKPEAGGAEGGGGEAVQPKASGLGAPRAALKFFERLHPQEDADDPHGERPALLDEPARRKARRGGPPPLLPASWRRTPRRTRLHLTSVRSSSASPSPQEPIAWPCAVCAVSAYAPLRTRCASAQALGGCLGRRKRAEIAARVGWLLRYCSGQRPLPGDAASGGMVQASLRRRRRQKGDARKCLRHVSNHDPPRSPVFAADSFVGDPHGHSRPLPRGWLGFRPLRRLAQVQLAAAAPRRAGPAAP